MQKDYRHCLDKLVGAVPERKAALIRSILPGIEAALNSGQSLKKIWEVLESEGLQMSYHGFHKAVWRARKMRKPTATSSGENRINLRTRKRCRKQMWKQLKNGTRWRI